MAKAKNTPRETRLLSEFLAMRYPNDRVLIQCRLGTPPPLPSGKPVDNMMLAVANNSRRYADAVVIRPGELVLIEAKVLPDPGCVSTLQLYARLLPSTPELKEYVNRPLRTIALWAFSDPMLAAIAKEDGIEVQVYTPPWVVESLRATNPGALRRTSPHWTPPEAV